MKPVDILFFVEHVARELDVACAVKYLIERDTGLEVALASLPFGSERARRDFRPATVAVPYFFNCSEWKLGSLLESWPDANFVNVAWEQLLARIYLEHRRPRDEVVLNHVRHLAMGAFFGDFLTGSGVREQNVTTIGSLSCTLYEAPYREFFDDRSKAELSRDFGLDPGKPWIFFADNYDAAFVDGKRLLNLARDGYDPALLFRFRDLAKREFRAVIGWFLDAAKSGSAELIFRPRPKMPENQFGRAVRQLQNGPLPRNLHVIKTGSVREWVMNSDVVMSPFSSTLVEAAVIGKPVYTIGHEPLPDFVKSQWHEIPDKIASRRRLIEIVESAGDLPPPAALQAWARANLMGSGDSIRNLVSVLVDSVNGEREPAPPSHCEPLRSILARGPSRSPVSLPNRLRALIPSHLGGRGEPFRLFEADRFGDEDVESRISRWRQILD